MIFNWLCLFAPVAYEPVETVTFAPLAVICGKPQSGIAPPPPQVAPAMFHTPFSIENVAPKSFDTAPRTTSGENALKLGVASHTTYSFGGLTLVSTNRPGSSSVLYPVPPIVWVFACGTVHAAPSPLHSDCATPNVCPPSCDTWYQRKAGFEQ